MNYIIKNGLVVDPAGGMEETRDILVSGGKIDRIGRALKADGAEAVDASGCIVAPALVDMHTHLRQPGREDEETVGTGTRAAAKGGYAAVVCMPNTEPALDTAAAIKELKAIVKKDAVTDVLIAGAITKSRLGKELADITGMKKEGIVAISDDGSSVEDALLMDKAFKAAKKEGLVVIAHCEDTKLSRGGVVNKGFISTKTGLRGIPAEAEFERVRRDIELAEKSGAMLHIAHVSCKESIEIIRKAKKRGAHVTAETAPHYFSLTDECAATYDTNTKMNPPLRSGEDVEAIKEALADGTLDAIATDHAPHTDAEKGVEFDYAPFGIIGLETALSLAVTELIDKKVLSWKGLIEKMSANPAKILGLGPRHIKEGAPADIVVIDPQKEYLYKKDSIESRSRNSPFLNWRLKGAARDLFLAGKIILKDGQIMK